MAKIERFEDIIAWQEARELTKMIYQFTKKQNVVKDYRFCNQIQSASISVVSNIAEGFSRKSDKEFVQFLFIAKASAAEVQSQLYVALDQNYIDEEDFNRFYNQAHKVSCFISNFIKFLRKSSPRPC